MNRLIEPCGNIINFFLSGNCLYRSVKSFGDDLVSNFFVVRQRWEFFSDICYEACAKAIDKVAFEKRGQLLRV